MVISAGAPQGTSERGSASSQYDLLARLAAGGMAEIFLARANSLAGLERYVVLKRIRPERGDDARWVAMFLDEARLAAQLQHPNIAQVYDIGKLGDSFFFTMEYVHGETVRSLLQRSHALRAPIPIGSVLAIAAGAAAGLHHAHERNGLDGKPLGIVHRDVSPSNLMASYEGSVKVVDFGVAKAAHRSQETRSGTVKGKISYLSPEQCRGNPVDRRSDLFSLGIVVWEMLTTERLYKRNADFEAMAAIVSEPVPLPSTRRADVPRELDALVMKLLAKDPNDRFQTADQVHEAIEAIAVRIGVALSTASLARYLRDLFGQRPEPWVEMRSREDHPEVFTVTSEPIPADLSPRPADALESQLGAVPDLSEHAGSESDASEQIIAMPSPRPPTGGVTLPFRTEPGPGPEAKPTTPYRAEGMVTMAGTGMRPLGLTGPQLTVTGPQLPITGPQQLPSYIPRDISGPNVAPPPSYSNAYPLYQKPPPDPNDIEKKKMPRALVIVLGAVTVGVIVGVVMALSGSSKVVGPRDAAAVVVMTTQHDAEIAAPPDAIETDAAVDARIAKGETSSPAEESPAEKLSRALDQGRNGDAVSTCIANPMLVDRVPVSCAIAACRARNEARARKWYTAAGNKKSSIVGACKAVGIQLEAPQPPIKDGTKPDPKKDCSDPMACQH